MTGSELKALREAAGLTQPDLARLLQVHPITVANWEGDKYAINGRTAQLVRLHCVPRAKSQDEPAVKAPRKKDGEKS